VRAAGPPSRASLRSTPVSVTFPILDIPFVLRKDTCSPRPGDTRSAGPAQDGAALPFCGELQGASLWLARFFCVSRAVLLAGRAWQPTVPLPFLGGLLSLTQGTVQFRFTPLGAGSGWQIDDVYVDPFKSR
jgi:hypothetical protein